MSTRNFIGSAKNSAHPLLDCDGHRVQQLRRVVVYLMPMNTAYPVMHLYANGIYAHDERHARILVSWIETSIFIRGVIIQMKPMKFKIFLTINPADKIQK